MTNHHKKNHPKKQSDLGSKKPGFFKAPLVPTCPLRTLVPNIINSATHDAKLQEQLKKMTFGDPTACVLTRTPTKGVNLQVDENGECGVTSSGSKLIFSASKVLKIESHDPTTGKSEVYELALLTRKQHYRPKQTHALFAALEASPISDESMVEVTATPESRQSQGPRKKARKESSAVKNTAKGLVFDYFEKCGIKIAADEIESENWNLCHILSYGIAMNAQGKDGETFDTQVYENIYSGTRVFNENMMRIENVLLMLLNQNNAKTIHYMGLVSEFTDSHILASLQLNISIETHEGTIISMPVMFDVTDDRKLSQEASTAYYATIQSLIKQSAPDAEADVQKTLDFARK